MGGVFSPPHVVCEQDGEQMSEASKRWRVDALGRNKLKLERWEKGDRGKDRTWVEAA